MLFTVGIHTPIITTISRGRGFAPAGLVVLLNTTTDKSPSKGPSTNLAGLFRISNVRGVNCDTIIEIWAALLVRKPIA